LATLCVTYDLSKPGREYNDLYEYLKSFGTWCRCLESTWLINTNKLCKDVRDEILKIIDSNDKLLVFSVGSDWAGYGLSKEIYDWLKNNWQSI